MYFCNKPYLHGQVLLPLEGLLECGELPVSEGSPSLPLLLTCGTEAAVLDTAVKSSAVLDSVGQCWTVLDSAVQCNPLHGAEPKN